jgi:hypothetical protein
VLVLDGNTGAVRARHTLSRERRDTGCDLNGNRQAAPMTIGPIVGTDGFGYVLVRQWTNSSCFDSSQHVGVILLRVSPSGSVSPTTLYSQFCDPAFSLNVCTHGPPELMELFPDGIGGTLARAHYYLDMTTDYPISETRVTRVHNGAVQFSNVVDFDERISMIGDAGTAFLSGDDVRAVDVTNWTPKWVSSNTSLEPVVALPNGKAAMHDVMSGQLIEFNETGAPGESVAFGGRWGSQTALGLWTSVSTPGMLTGRFSMPVNEATTSFNYLGALGTGQQAPRARHFDTREAAAVAALDFVSFITDITRVEWGGRICQKGNGFEWSRIVTSHDAGSVDIPFDLCSVDHSFAAAYHTHPLFFGSDVPSGPDLGHSDLKPGIPFYLSTKDLTGPGAGQKRQYLKWWNTGDRTSQQNVCRREANGGWFPYSQIAGTTDARCDTPTP